MPSRLALPLALAAAVNLAVAVDDVILNEDFCKAYYSGTGDCTALRSQVRANHSRTLPTLELGDAAKPVLLMLHGWPDTAAVWANQFERFCAPPHGRYFCVAPSLFHYHPQFPSRPAEQLLWDKQVDAFHAVVQEMGIGKVILVIHDFGCIFGYQYAYRYPEAVERIVSMDIGNEPSPPIGPFPPPLWSLQAYQQTNVNSFLANDDGMMLANAKGIGAPCAGCKVIQARIGWPYYQFVRGGGDEWHGRLAPSVPISQWRFMFTPTFPDVPMLFLYGKCDTGTGCRGCPPCARRSAFFFSEKFTKWVSSRPGSRVVPLPNVGHWVEDRNAAATNAAIEAWLGAGEATVLV